MTRARTGVRKLRGDGINRGVSHNIKKITKKKLAGKHTKIRPFGVSPSSPKMDGVGSCFAGSPVKPSDRVPKSPSPRKTINENNKFFRCRDLNRKATVSMSKERKYQLQKDGSLHRSPAPTRRGPYKNVPTAGTTPRPPPSFSPPTPSRDGITQRALLTAIAALDGDAAPLEGATSGPNTPSSARSIRLRLESSSDEGTPRRSPRKHQHSPGSAVATPGGKAALPPAAARRREVTPEPYTQTSVQTACTPTGAPLRRSPRKQQRGSLLLSLAQPTHAENEGPSRLSLGTPSPRRSPRKHPPQAAQPVSAPQRTPESVYDHLEEQLMRMEAGEDKENEPPGRRKKQDEEARFYSIFYRKPPGDKSANSPSTKGKPAKLKETRKSARVAGQGSSAGGGAGRLEQLVIDAGQRQFGVITCATCTLVYTVGDEEDEACHARHHTGYLSALAYPGWKRVRDVARYDDGQVVAVTAGDPAYAWKKVDAVLNIVDAELGFSGIGVRNKAQSTVYLYISDKRIVGCLVAERIAHGYPMLPRPEAEAEAPRTLQCATTPRPCRVGVSRIWVHRDYRRRRLASRLVFAMKSTFEPPQPLQWSDVAFSDPTPDGLEFAASVTGTDEFLVYNQ